MKNDFPRILTLLRKEKGLSQKEAATRLEVSQALLSHYEKGIRECGLDFIIRVADEYNVSTDYLLGRTSDRNGAVISADEIPEPDGSGDKSFRGSVVATMNKKLITNTVGIIFDMLNTPELKDFANEAGTYLSLASYKVFRTIYAANPDNPSAMFAIRASMSDGLSGAAMQVSETYLKALASGEKLGDLTAVTAQDAPSVSPETLNEKYPLGAASLFKLISTAEARMGAKPKK